MASLQLCTWAIYTVEECNVYCSVCNVILVRLFLTGTVHDCVLVWPDPSMYITPTNAVPSELEGAFTCAVTVGISNELTDHLKMAK